MASFNLHYLFKDSVSKYSHFKKNFFFNIYLFLFFCFGHVGSELRHVGSFFAASGFLSSCDVWA